MDLSRHAFRVRKADPRVKTVIKFRHSDLITKTKIKNETDWELVDDINEFGELSKIDLSLKWPQIEVKSLTSPPNGRACKNIHNFSHSDSESPEIKKLRKEAKKDLDRKNSSDGKKNSDASDKKN